MKILKAHKCNYRVIFTEDVDYIRYDSKTWGTFLKGHSEIDYVEIIYDKEEVEELEEEYQIFKAFNERIIKST